MLVLAKVSEIIYRCPTYVKWKNDLIPVCIPESCDNPCKVCYRVLQPTTIPSIIVDIDTVQNDINREVVIFLIEHFKNNSDMPTDLKQYFYSWYYSKIENNRVSTSAVWCNDSQVKEE